MTVMIADVFPIKNYIQPDIIGFREETREVCVVEVETNVDKFLEVMGKCMIWKTTATYVYIAYPKYISRFKVLEKFGIGLLEVWEDRIKELIKILPTEKSKYAPFRVKELHPVDLEKELGLYKQIKRMIVL